MTNYYSEKLNANNLKQCYELAPQRVKQALIAEIDFVAQHINRHQVVLELGCGYGRVAVPLAQKAQKVIGIDISRDNIQLAQEYSGNIDTCEFLVMDARKMSFPDHYIDVTLCVQNGISAFKLDPFALLQEAIRVTKNGGIILFSSYSEKFWDQRLEWFRIQAAHKLIGEIDETLTKDGVIVCKDGFRATTFSRQDFNELTSRLNVESEIHEVDESSVFCIIRKNPAGKM